MVGTPERRHHTRHRRVAAILARSAISAIIPIRERERWAERRRLARQRRGRARAALLRGMREVLGLSPRRRRRRLPRPLPADLEQPIVLSSDTSDGDLTLPDLEPQPPVVDLDSSLESLPNIDPRPQFQLPVQPLVDLGLLDVTIKLLPPLQHQPFREAYVLLRHLQLPPLQPVTPPPELPPRHSTPPLEQEDWVVLEAAVADFDGQHHFVLAPPPLVLQQPEVAPVPQFVPLSFEPPQPLQQVDWAAIAHALFTIAEREHEARHTNPN